MSLSGSPEYLFSPVHSHYPPADDGAIFNEVFDQELYNDDNNLGCVHTLTDEVLNLYNPDDFTEDYPRLPSLSGSTSQETSIGLSPPQPWRKGLWCLNQDVLKVEKTRRPIMDTVSASQLVNNPSLLIRKPPTPSLSPTMKSTKRFVTSPNAAKYRHKGMPHVPLSRENTLSPSPFYSQLALQAKMEQVETWQQDFKNFNLQGEVKRFGQHATESHNRGEQFSQVNNATLGRNGGAILPMSTIENAHTFIYHDNDSGLSLDPDLTQQSRHGLAIQTHLPTNDDAIMSAYSTAVSQNLAPVWTSESLHSSDSSHQSSHETMPPSLSSGISSTGLQNPMGQIWWTPDMTPATPGWATTPREPFPAIAAPTPKRAVTQSYADRIDHRAAGLGIHYNGFDTSQLTFQDSQLIYPSIETSHTSAPPYTSPQRGILPPGVPPVPPLPFHATHQNFTNVSPFNTPQRSRRSPTRMPSPSLSPLSANPRTAHRHNRSPSRPEQGHRQHRRKSIHKPGPIKSTTNARVEDPLPSANSISSSTTSCARSRSQSKPPRTPRTPKTPSTASFNVDFVNFTAKDASKLLHDVAPSGSSKTRARRDAEEKERRKKLSEAALKAVTSAGGDVDALKRAILA